VVDEADLRAGVFMTPERLAALRTQGVPVVVLSVYSDDSTAPRPWDREPKVAGAFHTYLASDFSAPSHPVHGSRPLPAIADLQVRVQHWGVDDDTLVVAYDHDGNLQAGRAWWVLKWAGIAHVRLLDGGFAAWVKAGLPTDRVAPRPNHGKARLSAGHMPVLDADQAARLAVDGVLLDSRVTINYEGAPVPPGQPRRGHIPGARSVPAPSALNPDGAFADPAMLRALYAAVGADGAKPVGVYCGAGVSAAHAVAALESIGVAAAMYPGSWSAWISDPLRPVAIGPEPGAPTQDEPAARARQVTGG